MKNRYTELFSQYQQPWSKTIGDMREIILANLVMISQIPSKTFEENERGIHVLNRFMDCGDVEPSTDEIGNVMATIKGQSQKRRILISAHMDTLYGREVDHNVTISEGKVQGAGIADNATGIAVLITLPEIFRKLGLNFESEIVLLATSKSKERGDLAGMRHFFAKSKKAIDFNLNLEGITLGQLDHNTLSRVRCDINCSMSGSTLTGLNNFGQSNSIMILNDIIESLYRIPLPRRPKTILNIGKITGGNSYSRVCTEASMGIEVRSEDDKTTDKLIQEIQDNCIDIGARYGVELGLDFFSRQHAAGIKYSHPLVKTATTVVKCLQRKPIMGPTNSEIAVPLANGVPAITLGITNGSESSSPSKHYIEIDPITDGILQILMVLMAIDKGYCDDDGQ